MFKTYAIKWKFKRFNKATGTFDKQIFTMGYDNPRITEYTGRDEAIKEEKAIFARVNPKSVLLKLEVAEVKAEKPKAVKK